MLLCSCVRSQSWSHCKYCLIISQQGPIRNNRSQCCVSQPSVRMLGAVLPLPRMNQWATSQSSSTCMLLSLMIRCLASGTGGEMSVADLSPCSYPGSLRLSHSAGWIMRIMFCILLETGLSLKITFCVCVMTGMSKADQCLM